MYGFCISEKGFLTNNYYKKKEYSEEPELQGIYIFIKKVGNEIIIKQDYYGNFGLYFYQYNDYFALSNSFLFLLEYLIGKKSLNFNKDFADNLIITGLYTPSIHETLIQEINKLPSDIVSTINIKKREFSYYKINYKENSIPFGSLESLEIIDKWVDKWGYIIRSLKKQTDNISFDLTGGFDTRTLFALFLNSNINLNDILINSIHDKKSVHEQDFNIAKNISSKYGLRLNNVTLDKSQIELNIKDSIFCEFYTKLGFHKSLNLKNYFYIKPRFTFTGGGGETIRGYPYLNIEEYKEKLIKNYKEIQGHEKEFYDSSNRLFERNINLIKKEKKISNSFDISPTLYTRGPAINHYGKISLKSFLSNWYSFQPLMDPDLKKIKFNLNRSTNHDLIAYIYIRFAPNLIEFPFEGKRALNYKSIKKAKKLNSKIKPYKRKFDYSKNFFIDFKRKYKGSSFGKFQNYNNYLKNIFRTKEFIHNIMLIYDNKIYEWAQEYKKKTNHIPLRHLYALLAISKTLGYLSINNYYLKNKNNSYHEKQFY